ncbi:MAG: hypothetical protein LBT37_06130 [Lactobacillaceae bacterium]|jgi:hypothetical protein|nr:hypothetical protein [Lactobacillaceae bacterium]
MDVTTYEIAWERDSLTDVNKYKQLPPPQIAFEISEWINDHDILSFDNFDGLVEFIANNWQLTDQSVRRLIGVLQDPTSGIVNSMLIG